MVVVRRDEDGMYRRKRRRKRKRTTTTRKRKQLRAGVRWSFAGVGIGRRWRRGEGAGEEGV